MKQVIKITMDSINRCDVCGCNCEHSTCKSCTILLQSSDESRYDSKQYDSPYCSDADTEVESDVETEVETKTDQQPKIDECVICYSELPGFTSVMMGCCSAKYCRKCVEQLFKCSVCNVIFPHAVWCRQNMIHTEHQAASRNIMELRNMFELIVETIADTELRS
jgi:hypothetical protein